MTMMMKLMLLHWSVDLRLELGSCRCVALPHIWARDNFSIQESNRITEHHVCPSFISTSRSSVSWWTQQKPHYTSVQVVSLLTVYSSLCGGTWSMQQRNLCKTCLRCTCFKLSTWAQPWWSEYTVHMMLLMNGRMNWYVSQCTSSIRDLNMGHDRCTLLAR